MIIIKIMAHFNNILYFKLTRIVINLIRYLNNKLSGSTPDSICNHFLNLTFFFYNKTKNIKCTILEFYVIISLILNQYLHSLFIV